MLERQSELGQTAELFKSLYPRRPADRRDIFDFLCQCDAHTSEPLEDKIRRGTMDCMEHRLTRGELLFFRLRTENAIRTLAILLQSPVPCELCTGIREEGICWALTTLWTLGRDLWLDRTSTAFAAGAPSALSPPSGH